MGKIRVKHKSKAQGLVRASSKSNGCKLSVAVLIVLVLGVCFLNLHYVLAQTDETGSKLQAASSAVTQAFNAVLDAEKSGANVTALLTQLNDAASLLAQAENSFRAGDAAAAANKADSVLPIAQEVSTAAQTAKKSGSVASQNALYFAISVTAVVAVVFVLILFLFWRLFKRNYVSRLFETKPEATDNEA